MEEMKIEEIKDKQYLIAETNDLILNMFKNTATKSQMALIYTIIAKVKPTDTEFTTYKITYKEYAELICPTNPRTKKINNLVRHSIFSIMQSCFCLYTDKKERYYHWVECAENVPDEKYFEFRLSKDIQKFYLDINNQDITYLILEELLSMQTNYQANVYRWCRLKAGFKNKVYISIEDAKRIFNQDESIATFKFTEKLNRAIQKINSKTTLNIKYETVKSRQNIIGYNFIIKKAQKEIARRKELS